MRSIVLLALLLASCEVAEDLEAGDPSVAPLRGNLDTGFGGDGKAWVGSWNGLEPRGVAVNGSGVTYSSRMVLSGLNWWLVGRARPDGTHDDTFGDSVYPINVNTYLGVDESLAGEVWVGPGGILGAFVRVVGTVYRNGSYRAVVVCLWSDGTLDTTCGNGKGYVEVAAPGFDHTGFRYVGVDADLRVVAVGKAWDGATGNPGSTDPLEGSGSSSGLVVRMDLQTGKLDTSFSGDGIAILDQAGSKGQLRMAIGPGRNDIVLSDLGLDRIFKLKENGSLDTSFSGDGKLTLDAAVEPTDVAVSADGLVFVAVRKKSGAEHFSALGFEADGSSHFARVDLDFTSFDNERATQIEWSADHERLYLVGWGEDEPTTSVADRRIALAALRPDGSVDLSFHGSGKDTIDFSSEWEEPRGLAVFQERLIGAVRPDDADVFGLGLFRYQLGVGKYQEPCKAGRTCTEGSCVSPFPTFGYRWCSEPLTIPTPPW